MSADYALEKFQSSVHMMAVSSDTLQGRLRSAFMTFHPVKDEDLPTDHLKQAYRDLMDRLTKVKDAHEGFVPATTRQMTDEEAREAAELIFDIFYRCREWVEEHRKR